MLEFSTMHFSYPVVDILINNSRSLTKQNFIITISKTLARVTKGLIQINLQFNCWRYIANNYMWSKPQMKTDSCCKLTTC